MTTSESLRRTLSGLLLTSLAAMPSTATGEETQRAKRSEARNHVAVLRQYCYTCHNRNQQEAGLAIDRLDMANPASDAESWEKIIQKLRRRTMPPAQMPRPDDDTYDAVASWLETEIDRAASAKPNPGRPLLHRMNRTEYRNAIRDLLAVDVDVSALPADDSASGFDNNADALGVSAALLESYITAARKIARLAVGSPAVAPTTTTYNTARDLTQSYHMRDMPLGTRGGIRVDEYLPVDGEYEIAVTLRRNAVGHIRGLVEEHQIELSLDGEQIGLFTIGGKDAYNPLTAGGLGANASSIADKNLRVRLPIPAGDHTIIATFLAKPAALLEQAGKPYLRSYVAANSLAGFPEVDRLLLKGPFDPARPRDSTSRDRIFSCQPADGSDETACAESIFMRLGRLAYRRPLEPPELERLLAFYAEGRRDHDFEAGIELALRYLLASPQFIFRLEEEPGDAAEGEVYRLNDYDIASRLSFFLWSSIPDDALLNAAERGELTDLDGLAHQVNRMLEHPKASALVENFAGQWLYVRNLRSTFPNQTNFPNFDDNLRQAMQQETELFIESIIREDRSVLELLTADYTYMNERLARHYGIRGVYGDRFRRVPVTDEHRRGLLGHGSVLTVTSHPTRTSPVLRGKWVLENLLGMAPPPPPPNIPALEESTKSAEGLSVRERLVQHRENPACAVCHSQMDPYGFGLENFDAVGRWRTIEADGAVINASDTLPDGTVFDGPTELREIILQRPNVFVDTMTRKLLIYALGRGLEYYDAPIVRRIVAQAASEGYRFSSLIEGIVMSEPFRTKMKPSIRPADVAEDEREHDDLPKDVQLQDNEPGSGSEEKS